MKNQHHQNCPFCKWITNKPDCAIEENRSFLSLANISPDSEGHILIITKEPRTNITELTPQEWNNLLPILKSTTNKLTNLFHPLGFNIYSNAGVEGGARQAVFHFHLHVVPEREGNRGVGYLRKPWFIPSPQKYQEIENSLQTNQGIIKENNQFIAKLTGREQASDYGHITITCKEFKSDLNQIDIETWSQMGELLRESFKKIELLNPSSLRVCIFLGKIGGLKSNSQLQIHLIPRYKSQGHEAKEVIPVPEEVLEVAEKLKKADSKVNNQDSCPTCQKSYTGWNEKGWCKVCNAWHFAQNFKNWTGNNPKIDELIQKYQLQATNYRQVLEWIPYEKFTNVKHIADGGFGKVYQAEWTDKCITFWDTENNRWKRHEIYPRKVALKNLNNSQNMTSEFLQEITHHKLLKGVSYDGIVQCYGISQEPETKNYVIVMDFIEEGNLREYLRNSKLSFREKLQQLSLIAKGLNYIHQQNLVHRDFHSGNILTRKSDNQQILSYIADLGLCKPVDEEKKEEVFGVLPYVAPEVLQKRPYTKGSDIYSFGIVAYELLSQTYPYHDWDLSDGVSQATLALKICEGLRPDLEGVKVPQLLKDLIKKCWEAEPEKRPTAGELKKIISDWCDEVRGAKDTKFVQQYKLIGTEYNQFFQNNSYQIHPTAILHSKMIDTGQLGLNLSMIEQFESLQEDSQEEAQMETKIEIPPK